MHRMRLINKVRKYTSFKIKKILVKTYFNLSKQNHDGKKNTKEQN